jgi:Sulfatase
VPSFIVCSHLIVNREPPEKPIPSIRRALAISVAVISVVVTCITLQIVRPTTPPYAHMSGSLPFTMLESLFSNPRNTEFCLPHPRRHVEFPFNEVFGNVTVEPAQGLFPGWMPQSETCHPRRHQAHEHEGLSASPSAEDGSEEYYETWIEPRRDLHRKHRPKIYNPSCDPLRITNLDKEILEPLEAVFSAQRPLIKHVVLLTLESTRKDMFPLRKESLIYDKILSTYEDANAAQHELNKKLSQLTPITETLTGESSGFDYPKENKDEQPSQAHWKSKLNDSYGGINVHGAITGSAFTFKSLLGSHCGVEPLPVDFTEEIKGRIYQPCVPQILELFNEQQKNASSEKTSNESKDQPDFLSSPWESVLVQSITDQFDSQDILDEHMGFKNTVMKSTLLNPSSKYYPPKEEESNYFGFPETEVLPYLRDIFTKAEQDNRRLFLSHVTSTTHHPYSTPKNWTEHEDYLAKGRWGSEDSFNRYLNTIKYQDEWIGTIFDLLQEVGIFDQTLVVIVGDQ